MSDLQATFFCFVICWKPIGIITKQRNNGTQHKRSIYIYTESQDNFPMLGSSVVYYVKHVMTLLLHEIFITRYFTLVISRITWGSLFIFGLTRRFAFHWLPKTKFEILGFWGSCFLIGGLRYFHCLSSKFLAF